MSAEHHKPDLSRRFQVEICFPEPDQPDVWDRIASLHSPSEALRRCSECLESVKDLLFAGLSREVDDRFIRIRVWDAMTDRHVLWEDEGGGLHASPYFFEELREPEVEEVILDR